MFGPAKHTTTRNNVKELFIIPCGTNCLLLITSTVSILYQVLAKMKIQTGRIKTFEMTLTLN